MSDTRLAWHFLHPNSRLLTGEVAPPDGEWLVHPGKVIPCTSGLHASERLIDALDYIPSEHKVVLCRVEVRGTIKDHGDPVDKFAASERRILWRLDGDTTDRMLREHARWSAKQVLHLWQAPKVVIDYLETGDEALRAAAGAAAWAAARDASRAAWAAAWAAAGAAWAAARFAAGAARAAWAAARDAQNAELERLVIAAHEAAS